MKEKNGPNQKSAEKRTRRIRAYERRSGRKAYSSKGMALRKRHIGEGENQKSAMKKERGTIQKRG